MRAAFKVNSTFMAEVAMDLDKQRIITEAVAQAEKLDLGANDYVIFDEHMRDLKIVVRLTQRKIDIMTTVEAKQAGLLDAHKRQQ